MTVYEFENFRDYLKVAGDQFMSRRNRPVTLEQWTKKLGYKSPRSIAMVLNGSRLPSSEMLEKLSRYFKHSDSECRYLGLLVQLEKRRRKGLDLGPVLEELTRLNPNRSYKATIEADRFSYIAEWYHFAIKQLIEAPHFKQDANWIRRQLRNKVTVEDVKRAIRTLLSLGIIEKNRSGKLVVSKKNIRTTQDIPSEAIRRHHKGMIQRGLEAVDAPDFNNREITSVTMRVKPDDVVRAKEEIRRFRESFIEMFESVDSSHVYQINLQFFEHTVPNSNTKGEKHEVTN